MIVITPYLVKPVSDSQIKLPTDGLHTPHDLERVILGTVTKNKGETDRPLPRVAPDSPAGPEIGSVSEAAPQLSKKPAAVAAAKAPAPGFSFND